MKIVTSTPDGIEVLSGETLNGHSHSRRAALIVFVLSAVFVFGLVGYLYWISQNQIHQIHMAYQSIQLATEAKPFDGVRVELEYQQLKNTRISNALLYRFSVAVVGIVVCLLTIILGSVLIFDRVVSVTPSTVDAKTPFDISLNASSPFPGFGMVCLGFFALIYTIYAAGPGAPKIETIDVPVFSTDLNPQRYAIGIHSTMTTAASDVQETNPDLFPEGEDFDFGSTENEGNDN